MKRLKTHPYGCSWTVDTDLEEQEHEDDWWCNQLLSPVVEEASGRFTTVTDRLREKIASYDFEHGKILSDAFKDTDVFFFYSSSFRVPAKIQGIDHQTAFSIKRPVTKGYFSQKSESELKVVFEQLAKEWYEDTGGLSNPREIAMHHSYQKIIGLGPKALPFIFEALRDRGGYWYWALGAITRTNPVPRDEFGNGKAMKKRWLDYAQEHGYL